MNSLEKHVAIIKQSDHNNLAKDKLIAMATFIWIKMSEKGQPITISSTVGGIHKKGSKHYKCEALDFNPDKGFSMSYVRILQEVLKDLPYPHRCLIEFNTAVDEMTGKKRYRCTHVEFNDNKTGVFSLDFNQNISHDLNWI